MTENELVTKLILLILYSASDPNDLILIDIRFYPLAIINCVSIIQVWLFNKFHTVYFFR